MGTTAFKPNASCFPREGNPFWVAAPTLDHFKKLLFDTPYPEWMWNTVIVSVVSTLFSLAASVLAAYAIERLRFKGSKQTGLLIFLAYLVPPSILFIPLATIVFKLGIFDTRWALILTYPDLPHPVLHVAPHGLLPLDSVRAGRVRADRRRDALADPREDHPAARGPGDSSPPASSPSRCRGTNSSTRSRFVSSSEVKTVPVGVVTELVEGDVYHWGSLMAGALLGSLPVAIMYSFFVEYYVAGMTGR
jgi:multiple sugar transport system permease protein